MLARSKLNSIENKISKALMDNEISHEDFETIINEEKRDKKIGINEVIKSNEIVNNNLKYKYV